MTRVVGHLGGPKGVTVVLVSRIQEKNKADTLARPVPQGDHGRCPTLEGYGRK